MMLPFVNILPTGPTGIGSTKPVGGEPVTLGVGDGQTFESLMNLFGMAEPSALSPINSESSPNPGTDAPVTSDFAQSLISSLMMGAANPVPTGETPAKFASAIGVPQSTDNQFAPVDPNQLVAQPELNLPFEQKLSLPVAQPWTMTMTQQRPVSLKPGKYQVLKQDINNGTLTMDLKANGQSAEPIKVTIPIELLHQESPDAIAPVAKQSAGAQITPTRVALVSPYSTDLESIIGKVNLRELEVSVEHTSAVYQVADEPMKVQIVAEQAGQNFLLAGKLNRAQLKEQTTIKKTVSTLATVPISENPTPAAANGLTVDNISIPRRRMAQKIAFESDSPAKSEDFALIDKLLTAVPKDTTTVKDGLEQFTFKSAVPAPQADAQTRLDIPRVKLTLPQEMPQVKVDGQTVLLKIEPEHLGPAKLQLSIKNDSLSARVTVDSVHAKAAVESSLDQLNDQLARAGVKVNYIEVNVRGGGAENQFFHRQSEWFRSHQPRVARMADELMSEISMIVPPSAPVSYIGADSINVFA